MFSSARFDHIECIAHSALGLLGKGERADVEELLGICADYWKPDPDTSLNESTALSEEMLPFDDPLARRRLGRLVEILARRSSQAMPFAALGRALLADLVGAERDRDQLLQEFESKLSMLGI